MTDMRRLRDLGQSMWLDGISRSMLDSGELAELVDEGLGGVTTNPTIFDGAVAGSGDYDEAIERLVREGVDDQRIYEKIVLEDVGRAADVLRAVYDRTGGDDGFVSIEVDPKLAYDTDGSLAEAKYFLDSLRRPNVMVKIPATPQGFPAVERLTEEGRNVNITLMFSLADYEAVADAYMTGLERYAAKGGDLGVVHSVASFFVSRVDVLVDDLLGRTGHERMRGRIGIANAKVVYARYRELLAGDRWRRLAARGARVQRLLWASTSVKDPAYPDLMYVENLMGADTVDTVPASTLRAFRDHGEVADRLGQGLEQARGELDELAASGIDIEGVSDRLEHEGVQKFEQSLDSLLATIALKRTALGAGPRVR